MMRRRLGFGGFALLLVFALASAGPSVGAAQDTLPTRLSDEEFWRLSQQMSEASGYFRSDNLLSNELRYPEVIPDLVERVKDGGRVYLGVGPEQNFNYIAAMKPKMVFITDIRRGNLHLQLMYKALFELSADRNEFVSRLFTKPKQASVTPKTSVGDLMTAYWALESSPKEAYDRNLREIKDHLTKKPHTLPLSAEDLEGIETVYYWFYWFGPTLTYNSSSSNGFGSGRNMATYDDLMRAVDSDGIPRSYLATEESFQILRDLETRNLIVPVVGNFGGTKALRAVGQYIRDHGATVAAFYLSNVEQYLQQDGLWTAFCANVAAMPLTDSSTFIRSRNGGGGFGGGGGFMNYLGPMAAETAACRPASVGAAPVPAN
jgi:hypothetical protein